MLGSRAPAPLMVEGGWVDAVVGSAAESVSGVAAAATQSTVAQSAYASLAETAASAVQPNAYADPLLVIGGVVAGISVLALFIYLFVNALMGGQSDVPAASPARPSAAAPPDASPRAGFLGRNAGAIFAGGLANLGEKPVGWLFGDSSPLYSNTAPPAPEAPASRRKAKEVGRQSGAAPTAVKPRPAAAQPFVAPSAKPFGGRFEAPAATPVAVASPGTVAVPVASPVASPAAAPVARVTATPVAPAAAPTATVVIARPVAAPPAATAAPPPRPAVIAVPVAKVTPVARAVAPGPAAAAAPPAVAVAIPISAAPPPVVAAPAPAPPASAAPNAAPSLAVLTERVSELTERNNQLVAMMADLQRQVNEVKAGK
jgi:hypothetical protein